MRLAILAIALSMVVLTIAAAEVRTQEAANMQGTSDSSSCPQYKKIPELYPKCGNYTKNSIAMKFRLSIVSTLWDRLVNTKYTDEVVKKLQGIFRNHGRALKTLTPNLYLSAEWDKDENTTETALYNDLPSGDMWIKKWDSVSTPITDLLQDGKRINIVLIDEFTDDESRYKCRTTLEGNTIVQPVGPLFYEKDLFGGLTVWDFNLTEYNKIAQGVFDKITEKVGIKKWKSNEKRFDGNKDICEGIMEGFKYDFSKCSSNEFQHYLDSDGGHSLIRLIDKDLFKPHIRLWVRVFANDKLMEQHEQYQLKSTKDTVMDWFGKLALSGPLHLNPKLNVKACKAEGITVLPWPDEIEGSGMTRLEGSDMTELEEAIEKTIDTTSIMTQLNLIMLDKSTYDSVSDKLPGQHEPMTCNNANVISARTLVMWLEPGDKMTKDKTIELIITIAKKLGVKDNRQSNQVIKDSEGKTCDGIMEGGDIKFSKCSQEDFDKYLDSDEGRCFRVETGDPSLDVNHPCTKASTSCEGCANGWVG